MRDASSEDRDGNFALTVDGQFETDIGTNGKRENEKMSELRQMEFKKKTEGLEVGGMETEIGEDIVQDTDTLALIEELLDERIVRAVREMGFEKLTPIQEQSIPFLLLSARPRRGRERRLPLAYLRCKRLIPNPGNCR